MKVSSSHLSAWASAGRALNAELLPGSISSGDRFFLPGRQMIEQPRQHLPLLGHLKIHPPHAVGDARRRWSTRIRLEWRFMASSTSRKSAHLSQLVRGLDLQRHHPLQGLLPHG